MQSQRPTGVAARAGLITGLFVGILSLPVITLSVTLAAVRRAAGGSALGFFFLIAALIAFAVAGYIATRHSGLLRSGTGAGALASLVATFVAVCLGTVIIILLASRVAAIAPLARGGGRVVAIALRQIISRSIVSGILLLGAGPLGGFIGALLGRLGRPAQPNAPAFTAGGPVVPPFTPQAAAPFAPPPAYGAPVTPTSPTIPSNPPQPYNITPAFPRE